MTHKVFLEIPKALMLSLILLMSGPAQQTAESLRLGVPWTATTPFDDKLNRSGYFEFQTYFNPIGGGFNQHYLLEKLFRTAKSFRYSPDGGRDH